MQMARDGLPIKKGLPHIEESLNWLFSNSPTQRRVFRLILANATTFVPFGEPSPVRGRVARAITRPLTGLGSPELIRRHKEAPMNADWRTRYDAALVAAQEAGNFALQYFG